MVFWIILPIALSLVSFLGTWSVYGLAYSNNHVCSLSDWIGNKHCKGNETKECCYIPTISASGSLAPESSLFTATINAGAFMFLIFVIFHHAHILERHMCHSTLSRTALIFGVVSSLGGFVAGNCNLLQLTFLHYFGAVISFVCVCFYTFLLSALTWKCVLTGFEKFLFPLRMVFSCVQVIVTLCYIFLFIQVDYYHNHLAAVFEWMLSVNLQLFQFSYVAEFFFFSSFMLSNLLSRRGEEKPLIISLS